MQSRRRLKCEAGCNVEVKRLPGRFLPNHKTVAAKCTMSRAAGPRPSVVSRGPDTSAHFLVRITETVRVDKTKEYAGLGARRSAQKTSWRGPWGFLRSRQQGPRYFARPLRRSVDPQPYRRKTLNHLSFCQKATLPFRYISIQSPRERTAEVFSKGAQHSPRLRNGRYSHHINRDMI